MAEASCRSWYEGDALLEAYHDTEWCKVTHDDQAIQESYGSFDAYLWQFTKRQIMDHKWEQLSDIPTVSDLSQQLSKDMKKRGMVFVGPVITYSFLQAIGVVNDHLISCPYR